MRANVRRIIARGADLIKIIATGAVLTSGTNPARLEFTEDEIRAAVEECDLLGAHVAAHAHGPRGSCARRAPACRSVEHASLIDDEALALVVDRGTYLVIDISDGDHMEEEGPESSATPTR
jgi:imidazolonepropionase-like amidohydrolase